MSVPFFEWPDARLSADNAVSTDELVAQLVIIRESRGLTLEQVAQRMGVNKSTISRFERGNTNPTLRTVRRYAEAVGAFLATMAVPLEDSPPWKELLLKTTDALDAGEAPPL